MKNFTQKFIGLVFLVFAVILTVNAQDNDNLYFDTFYSEDFESILGPEWNTSTGELINYNGTSLLGNLAHESISADISNLPLYDSILIEFDLYIFDSWDGQQDQFQVRINEELVLNTTFLNGTNHSDKWQCFPENCPVNNPSYTGAYSYNLPQLYSHGDISALYKLSFVIDNQVANVVAEFTSNSDTDFIDESWGVDNFKLSSYSSDPLEINLTDQEMSYEGFFNNSYYYVSNQGTSWYNADSISSSLGGYLVSINSQDENNLVQSFLNSENAWIGLNDTLMEGNWVWSSGEQFDYNNWADGEPNNDDMIEHFVHINYSGNGDWNDDTDENSQFLFVMEVEAIYGCSDPTMYNYDSNVNTVNNSCYPMIYGCMNPIAGNYVNPIGDVQIDVNTDDGSCIYSSDVYDNILEELSVFETVEEEQDYSLSFDGDDDYIETSYFGISGSNERSISVSASNGYGCLFSYGGEGDLNGLKDAFLCFLNESNNSIEINIDYSTYQYQLDELLTWNDFTIVLPNNSSLLSDLLVYQNGELLPYLSGNDGVINTELEVPINIGRNYRNQNYYSGTINNLIFWDTALSQNEIQSYNLCPPSGDEEGLVGYWNFNEGEGDSVYDLSGNGNHGVIYGTEFNEDVPESYKGCTDENALNFDTEALCDNGSCVFADNVVSNLEEELSVFETVEEEQNYSLKLNDSQVLISDNLTFSSNNGLSFLLNVKMTNLNKQHFIDIGEAIGVENYLRYVIKYENGLIQAFMEGPGWGSSGNQSHLNHEIEGLSDAWIKIGVTFDNSASKLYVDGVLVDTKEYNYSENIQIVSSPNSIISGNNFQSYGYRFNGSIEDLQIWGTTLSNDEIQSYITCPPTGNEENLVAYWNFNEGSGNTVYDLSGNGNNGIIYEGYVGGPNNAEFSEDVPESNNGCTDVNALNYDATAQCDNGSCVYGDDEYSAIGLDLDNTNSTLNNVLDTWQSSIDLTNSTLDEVSLINQTLNSFNTVIDLSEGWNMFGYGCPQPMDVAEGLSSYTDLIIITKDNNGAVYMPEFSFNGIGSFTPGYGYQIKISEVIEGFSLCGEFINTDNPQILDIEENNAQMQNDINCLTGNPEIGDHCYGGIVFYVDEGIEGKFGLVAAMEDLPEMYPWGCSESVISGAYGLVIGTGLQNTLDIVSGCSESPTAASMALEYENNGYSEWYLPSFDELMEMFNTIGNAGPNGNIGSFKDDWYISSSEFDNDPTNVWINNFSETFPNPGGGHKSIPNNVRPIRSFGNWTMGCMDSLACNYNPEANMADGSCEYAQEGYDCDGNITAQIGDIMEGGYLFYIDETGGHGLVAAMEDLEGIYEWGCHGTSLAGADGETIGTGYLNTLDIVAGCSETPIAASEAIAYDGGGYNDWYLPSLDEFMEMYDLLVYGNLQSNIYGFTSDWYWTSSELGNNPAWGMHLTHNSPVENHFKHNASKVRPIRSF